MSARDAAGPQWRKSSYSNENGACVEVADLPGGTAVRDSKLGDHSPILTFTPDGWTALLDTLRSAE